MTSHEGSTEGAGRKVKQYNNDVNMKSFMDKLRQLIMNAKYLQNQAEGGM